MNNGTIYHRLQAAKANRKKKFAVLIDPDKAMPESLLQTVEWSVKSGVDYFFIGGSLLMNDTISECTDVIKSCSEIPVIIFPGSPSQIHSNADAILLLSLISGRNADLLIGQHVTAANALRESRLEVVSAGYMLVDGGQFTTVSYISGTLPIPRHKSDIAVATAMAGEMLGLKLIYLEAGSGAMESVSTEMVKAVSGAIDIPLIVGGGIRTPEQASALCCAGADMLVVGTAAEQDPSIIASISHAIHSSIAV